MKKGGGGRKGGGSVKIIHLYPVPEIVDPVFAKTSQNARFLLSENERFGLVFVKTGSINSGTELKRSHICSAHITHTPTSISSCWGSAIENIKLVSQSG